MIITIIGKHPISNNPTSTTISVEEMDFDFNNSIYREILEKNGRNWKLYKLLEDVTGFARFHSDENNPDGHWLTLLWSLTSIDAKNTLELSFENSAENKSLCEVKKDTTLWVGKHNLNENDQMYVENEENICFINSKNT